MQIFSVKKAESIWKPIKACLTLTWARHCSVPAHSSDDMLATALFTVLASAGMASAWFRVSCTAPLVQERYVACYILGENCAHLASRISASTLSSARECPRRNMCTPSAAVPVESFLASRLLWAHKSRSTLNQTLPRTLLMIPSAPLTVPTAL